MGESLSRQRRTAAVGVVDNDGLGVGRSVGRGFCRGKRPLSTAAMGLQLE